MNACLWLQQIVDTYKPRHSSNLFDHIGVFAQLCNVQENTCYVW